MENRPTPLAEREAALAARARASRWMAVFSPAMIPPLLQTPEYARLALTLGRDAPDDEAAAIRMEAQTVLHEEGRRFAFLLTESAVRTRPGPASLMPAQLDRLAQVATLPHVRIGVIPWTAPAAVFPLHGFTLYDGTASVVETLTGDLTLTSEAELAAHEDAFESLAATAVYGDELRELLDKIAREA